MLSESPDQVHLTLQKSQLEINKIVCAVTTARHGVGWEKSRWFLKESPQVRREMVVDEVPKMEEERLQCTSCLPSQARQVGLLGDR